jgi:ABC-type nitrate/sulfonate/bicarbonate transport system permease component
VRRLTVRRRLYFIAFFAASLAAWEAAVGAKLLSSFLFPPPTEIAQAIREGVSAGTLPRHMTATLRRLFLGCFMGGGFGLILGFLVGFSRRAGYAIEPLVAAIHPVPKIALYPFLMVLFGIGETSLQLVPALSAFFPMFVNTVAGVRQIRPVYFDLVKTCGGQRREALLHVALPGSLPNILAAARLSLNSAFVVTIGIEMLSAQSGLGSLLWLSRETLRVDVMWSLLFLISALGASLTFSLERLGAVLTPWATPAEQEGGRSFVA